MTEKMPPGGNPFLSAVGVLVIVFIALYACTHVPRGDEPTPAPTVTTTRSLR